MLNKERETTKNTRIVDETKTKEEKGKEDASACIIEEINFGIGIESNTAREAKNGITLDTGCTSSVVGERWLQEYLQELTEERRGEVKGPVRSSKVFKFGNS